MAAPAASTFVVFVGLAVITAIAACVVVWARLIVNWWAGRSVLPYESRRPVPWRLRDVALAVIVYLAAPIVLVGLGHQWFGLSMDRAVAEEMPLDANHPLARVLIDSPSGWAIWVCILSAVVVAPLTEEVVFRLVLQGWLESVERRMRRSMRGLARIAGAGPIMLVALLFAGMHLREPAPPMPSSTLALLLGIQTVANLLSVALILCWLRFVVRAKGVDLGIVSGKVAGDFRIGLVGFLAVTVPVYMVLIVAKKLLPGNTVADPIPLLLLAVVLGTLYYRTHRILPAIVLHMAFNSVAVLLALGLGQ